MRRVSSVTRQKISKSLKEFHRRHGRAANDLNEVVKFTVKEGQRLRRLREHEQMKRRLKNITQSTAPATLHRPKRRKLGGSPLPSDLRLTQADRIWSKRGK